LTPVKKLNVSVIYDCWVGRVMLILDHGQIQSHHQTIPVGLVTAKLVQPTLNNG